MIAIDSSSMILLAKTGMLDKVIEGLSEKLVITDKVYYESTAKKEAFDAKIIQKRISENIIEKRSIKNLGLYKRIKEDFSLGAGEAESIVLCLEKGFGIITDDKKAMNVCKILRIRFTTILNLLAALHNKDKITKEETIIALSKLEKFGRYSNDMLQKFKEELR